MSTEETLNEVELKFMLHNLQELATNIQESTQTTSLVLSSDKYLEMSNLSEDKKAMVKAFKLISPETFDKAVKEFQEILTENNNIKLKMISDITTKLALQKSLL